MDNPLIKRFITMYVFSDTHMLHQHLKRVKADMYIHCGDGLRKGNRDEVILLAQFLKQVVTDGFVEKEEDIIYVPGNHDAHIEYQFQDSKEIFGNIHVLINQTIEKFGLKFHGSPYTPEFGIYSFMDRDMNLGHHWNKIPHDVDVLITHGPAKGILDYNGFGQNVGSETLLQKIGSLFNLKLHLFGHIHHSRGYLKKNGVYYFNSCVPFMKVKSFDLMTHIHHGYLITFDTQNKVVFNVEEVL